MGKRKEPNAGHGGLRSKGRTHGTSRWHMRNRRDAEQRMARAEKQARRRERKVNGGTWTCHVCGKERPDAMISVYKVDTSASHGLPPGTMTQNIRYCNDDPACVVGARSTRHSGEPDASDTDA